jgi:protein-tyrosine phosphatase
LKFHELILTTLVLFGLSLFVQAANPSATKLEGQPNFRDLGGYATADGRRVKVGEVFRAGKLSTLTDADVRELKAIGIETVVNFLTEEEIEAGGEDRLPRGVRAIGLPIAGGDADDSGGLAGTILEARQKADFSRIPVELNLEIHRLLVRAAREQYAALLRELADSEKRPLVFHCSHGVHRTGTAAAIVLSALGVPWETVRKDYLLSNEYRKEEVAKRLEQLCEQAAKNQGIPPEQVDMTNINAFYVLQPTYIDASLDEAVKQYGSMENYIRDGLRIEDALIEKLRNELLE